MMTTEHDTADRPASPLEHLVRRLRDSACGFTEWRVQDPVTGAYCIAFDSLNGGRTAAEGWLADHCNRYPGGLHSDYVVAEVAVIGDRDELLREAADAIEKLQNERDFLVDEYERAVGCGPQGYLHAAMHLFNAITNARIDAAMKLTPNTGLSGLGAAHDDH